MRPPRKRAQAIALGRGRDQRLVVPLAFETAAAISARPLDVFLRDPTQLANGLAELARAIAADGAVVACADGMEREAEALDEAAMLTGAGRGGVSKPAGVCVRARALALVAGVTSPATLARQFGATLAQADPVFAARLYCAAGRISCWCSKTSPATPSRPGRLPCARPATSRFRQATARVGIDPSRDAREAGAGRTVAGGRRLRHDCGGAARRRHRGVARLARAARGD